MKDFVKDFDPKKMMGAMSHACQNSFLSQLGSVSVKPMDAPTGKLFFMDFIDDPKDYNFWILYFEGVLVGITPFKERVIDYIRPGIKTDHANKPKSNFS